MAALGAEIVSGDLSDRPALAEGMRGADAVIHGAAVYEVGIPKSQHEAMRQANVIGTENVLGAALDAKIPKVVYVSTVAVFGNTHGKVVDESFENPGTDFTSYYEQTKWEAHQVAKRLIGEGLPCVIIQPGGVYGPDDHSATGQTFHQLLDGKLPMMPFPELGLTLAHVEDIATGIILGLDKGEAGEAYVIGGEITTMRGALEAVGRVADVKVPKRAMPTGLLKALTPIGPVIGKLMGQPPNLRELIASADGVTFWATHDKATEKLGYSPRGLDDGIRATLTAEGRL